MMNTKLMALKVAARYQKSAGCGCEPGCACGGNCGDSCGCECGGSCGESEGNYMAPQALESLRSHAEALQAKIDAGDEIPDWVEYKLAQAAQMVTDLMEYYEHSPSQKFSSLGLPPRGLVEFAKLKGLRNPFSDWGELLEVILFHPFYYKNILHSGFEEEDEDSDKGKAWVMFQGTVTMPWKELGYFMYEDELKVLKEWLLDRNNQKALCAQVNTFFKREGEALMQESDPVEDAFFGIKAPGVKKIYLDSTVFLEVLFQCKGVTRRGLVLEIDYREERDAMGDFRP